MTIDDTFDVAVLGNVPGPGQPAEVLSLEKYPFHDEQSTIKITVDKKPISAGIDPYNKMIDRNPDDNLRSI